VQFSPEEIRAHQYKASIPRDFAKRNKKASHSVKGPGAPADGNLSVGLSRTYMGESPADGDIHDMQSPDAV
jgi:hypothetical protein